MKKIALTIAALAMTAGAAFAENPNVGTPDDLYSNDKTPVSVSAAVATQAASQRKSADTYTDGSANGFGDHSPSSYNR